MTANDFFTADWAINVRRQNEGSLVSLTISPGLNRDLAEERGVDSFAGSRLRGGGTVIVGIIANITSSSLRNGWCIGDYVFANLELQEIEDVVFD